MSSLRAQLVDSQNNVKQQHEEISELTRVQSELTHQLRQSQQELTLLQRHTEEVDQNHIQQLAEYTRQLTEERQVLTLLRSQSRDQQTTIHTLEEQHQQNDMQLSLLRQHCQDTDQELIEKRKDISVLRASLADKEVRFTIAKHHDVLLYPTVYLCLPLQYISTSISSSHK